MSREYREMLESTRAALAERFPVIVAKKSHEPKRPLAIGIHTDLIAAAPDLDPKHIMLTIRDYVTGPKYFQAVIAGGARFDAHGNPVGEVTENQQEHARTALKVYRQKERARRPKTRIVEPEAAPSLRDAA